MKGLASKFKMLKSRLKVRQEAAMLSACLAVGLAAAWPLFVPRLPHGTDSLTHFYTLIQLDQMMQQGIFYSRWLPYRASGLGTPLFHYYAPLAYYVMQGFNFLSGDPLLTLRLAFGLTLVGSGLGTYLWVREVVKQESAALVAAAAYGWGPYMLFNAFFRGGLAEQFALMLMPLILWTFRRLAVTGQARYLAASAATYTALILAHNVTAFIFSPVLLAHALLVAGDHPSVLADGKSYQTRVRGFLKHTLRYALRFAHGYSGCVYKPKIILSSPDRREWAYRRVIFGNMLNSGYQKTMATLLAAIGLGLGLSSFFWLPAWLEREAIAADLLYTLPGLDYHQHFMPLTALLIAPLTSTLRPGLSLAAIGLALIGLWRVWPNKASRAEEEKSHSRFSSVLWRHSCFAALVGLGCLLMVLPLSGWIWDALPPLHFFQFPQRFLGVASLFCAFLAGVGLFSLRQRLNQGQAVTLTFAVLGLLLSQTWGLAQVRYYPALPPIDVNFTMQKEREQGLLNTVYSGNFIPATVKTLPSIEQMAQASSERLDSTSLPAEAAVITADYSPLRYEVVLSTPQPFTLRFNTFYFPGWQAQLDGQAVLLLPTEPHGLISLEVPAGQHRLAVWFGSTPERTLANSLSLGSAVILGGMIIVMRRQRHEA